MLPKLHIQRPTISFCIFYILPYRLVWNLGFSLNMLNFSLERRWMVPLWAHMSGQCLDYPIHKTTNYWCNFHTHGNDRITYTACTVLVDKALIPSDVNHCHKATLRSAKMHDQKSLTLHWRSFSGWGREHVAIVFAPQGGQYIIYGCLWPIAS